MVRKPQQPDEKLLVSLAEYQVLSARQLTVLHDRNGNALRRRLRQLCAEGLIRFITRTPDGRPGRPDKIVALDHKGASLLHARGLLDITTPSEDVVFSRRRSIEHELLVNDVRIQLVQLGRLMRAICVRFLAPTSPYLRQTVDGRLMTHERIERWPGANEWIEFIPDGVLTLRHETLGKTLLFFLEVDRSTEPLSTRGKRRACMQVKFDNYQKFLHGEGYKRYENVCGSALRGFRVLVITTADVRLAALCRLLREIPGSEFVWLTTRNQLIQRGCWAPIWIAGSRSDDSPLSILGSQTPRPCLSPSDLANAGRRA